MSDAEEPRGMLPSSIRSAIRPVWARSMRSMQASGDEFVKKDAQESEIRTLVVLKLNILPRDALLLVFFLLRLEHVLVKLFMQLLVGVVNAKLLESVRLEDFEAVNIEDLEE